MADITKTVVTKMELDTTQVQKGLKDAEKGQKDLGKATKDTKKSTEQSSRAMGSLTEGLDKATGGMISMAKGTLGMVKGLRSVRVAIAATGIGALILAISSLFAWFNRTAEGQEKFAKITAGLSAIFETLADVASSLGETLFAAFENPKQAVKDLWEFIKSQFLNRLEAVANIAGRVGRAIQAAFKFDFATVKDEVKGIGTEFAQLATGLDAQQQAGVLQWMADKTAEIKTNMSDSVALQERENQLRRETIGFITREAELNTMIAEARLIANTESEELHIRQKAINEAIELTNELYNEQVRLKMEEVEIARERDAQFDSNLDDAEELARLEAELIALGGQRAAGLQRLVLRQTALNKLTEENIEVKRTLEKEAEDQSLEDALERVTILRDARLEATEAEKAAFLDAEESKKAANKETLSAIGKISSEVASFSKETAIFNVILRTAEAIVAAAPNPLAIAAAAAIGAVQLSIVSNAKPPTPRFARGGMLGGELHSSGGTLIEAERGEAILNRTSMSNPYLRQLASDINTAGGGVAFAEQGMMVGQARLNSSIMGLSGDFDRSLTQNRAVLVTEDLNAVQGRVDVTEDTATL